MNRKELPNAVIGLLKDISERVKKFNLSADYPLVARPATDDYLLLIYPKGHEELFFRIDSFNNEDIYTVKEQIVYSIQINSRSFHLITGQEKKSVTFKYERVDTLSFF